MSLGPTRGELLFRLFFSLAGLALLVFALLFRGMPQGPAMIEIIGISTVFFGGTAIWAGWKLFNQDTDEE